MFKSLLYNRNNPLPCLIPMRSYINLTGQHLLLVVYHTVCDEVPPHIKHLYRPRDIAAFTDDMRFILKHYQPIDLQQLKEVVFNNVKPKKNQFFVSFDDGLSEFYYHAAPLLLKLGIPATNFLNNDFIDNNDLFYRYKVSMLIEEIQKKKEKKEFWEQFHVLKEKFGIPHGYYRTVLLGLHHTDIPFIDEAAKLVGIDFKTWMKKSKPYMTSEQIRELMDKGFTFGSHSFNHPQFGLLNREERIRHSIESTKEMVKKFGLKDKIFAFPFTDHGMDKSFFEALYAGNDIELSFGAAGLKKDAVKRNLQRIPMEEFNLKGERRLKTDYFYYLLKGLAGKNTIPH
jgi:peptidoglycan/xylan/chitin deacetylase (PgdA/CDA1 family)